MATTKADQAPILPKRLVTGLQTGQQASGLGKDLLLQNKYTGFTLQELSSALRQATDDATRLRIIARASPDGANAVSALVRTAKTPLSLVAYDANHQVSELGLSLLANLQRKLFHDSDYTEGYNTRQSLGGLTETLLREVPITGATAIEMVLDNARMPSYLQPVSPSVIQWKTSKTVKISGGASPDAYKQIPYQRVLGKVVELDVPNFFYAAFDQDPTTPYPHSMLEPAIMTTIVNEGVQADIIRAVRQTGHSRIYIELAYEMMVKAMPMNIRSAPPEEQEAWLETQRKNVEQVINGLEPNQGFALWDYAKAAYLNSNIGASSDPSPLLETMDARMASSCKVPPAVLAKRMSSGSQNTSSTEALLFLLTAEAMEEPVQTVYSRAFTLALRLMGFDGYVTAVFAKPNLRPDMELSSFKVMYQTLVLNLLSLGFVTDDEAAQMFGTGPLSPDHEPLSGTRFMDKANQANTPDPSSTADPVKINETGNAPKDTPNRAAKGAKR
jgi:hypothetical protein